MSDISKSKFTLNQPTPSTPPLPKNPWMVMIADDEQMVHEITRQVLRSLEYDERPVQFISVYSGKEAIETIQSRKDIAAILLDVVMESDEAGLEVARFIRQDLKNHSTRIILRTGQAGMAPERRVIMDYDINDYKDKTELTATKLSTSIVASLRDYKLITRLERCLKGMENVVATLHELLKVRSFERFSEGILTQVLSLLDLDESGLYVDAYGCTAQGAHGDYRVIAGTGEFANPQLKSGNARLPQEVLHVLDQATEQKNHIYLEDELVGYIPSRSNEIARLLYLRGVKGLSQDHHVLLETLLNNVTTALDTVLELEQIDQSSKEGV
ncbi:MAG: DUF3369 domain-containing protein [Spirochaetales bacterium]|nr:DUF3369 domain-containing protein [Spirochaetales bacterium]